MTAKEEILAMLDQIPEGLTVSETMALLRSINDAKAGSEEHGKAVKGTPPDSVPPPLDGQAIKAEIVAIMERLPADLTAAEAVCEAADHLRLFFLIQKDFADIREGRVPPLEEQDFTPVFRDEVPEIGPISGDDFERMTIKEKFIHTMNRLPDDLTLRRAVYEALERLLLVYKLDRSFEQLRTGQGIPHEEVKRRFAEWREQRRMTESSQEERL